MASDEFDKQDEQDEQLDLELETISTNQLTELGNRAIQLGLIAGHGYHGGQYELLRQGQFILLPPHEAEQYLRALIDDSQP